MKPGGALGADGPATLVELVEHRARVDAARPAFVFLPDGRTESARLDFAGVHRRATAIAATLQGLGAAGERVLITYPGQHLEEYVTGFLGCVMAGAVAVPCDSLSSRGGAERLEWVVRDARPAVVLGPVSDADRVAQLAPRSRHLDVAAVPDFVGAAWTRPGVGPSDLALLQYTSGSTRNPRGVRVTHANVLANERAIAAACEHDRDSHFVGWLPLFHDMGMIADVLQPLYLGSMSVLMPPTAFLRDPLRWLSAIHRYGGVGGGGPNFAFEFCARRIAEDQRAGLDLSSWRTAFNGADVVREPTLHRFVRAFGPAGFAPESFFACYGLAEATLIVAGAPRRRPPVVLTADEEGLRGGRLQPPAARADGRPVVSSGRVVLDTTVLVVDPATGRRLPDGDVGEVWVRGPGVADGYWGDPGVSDTFNGRVEGDEGPPFLRTGDLGALVGEELYLVGRNKDLIIVRGANHHPADIEWTVEHSTADVRPSYLAVFAAPGDGAAAERVVVVCEPATNEALGRLPQLAAAVRSAVAARHGLPIDEIVLAARGSVPKTTSGKVRRAACRAAHLEGGLRVLGRSLAGPEQRAVDDVRLPAPAELLAGTAEVATRRLVHALVAVAGATVPAERVLTVTASELGLDSVRAVELQHHLQIRYAAVLAPFTLLGDRPLGAICATVLDELRAGGSAAAQPLPAEGEGPASLTQQAIVLEQQLAPPGPAYVLTRALRLRGDVDRPALHRAVARVAERHAALRTRLRWHDGVAVQVTGPVPAGLLTDRPAFADLSASLAADAARGMPADADRLVEFTLSRRAGNDWVLVLRAHHAVVDFWSAVVLVRELLALYDEETGGPVADLPPPGPGPVAQAQEEADLLSSAEGDRLRAYWTQRLAGAPQVSALPHPKRRPSVRLFHGGTVRTQVDAATTTALRALASAADTTLFTVLLAASQLLTARLTGRRDVVVGTFAAGRDREDLAHAIGCRTTLVAVRLDVDPAADVITLLRRARAGLVADLSHSRLPFPEVVRTVTPNRDPARLPIVQTAVVLQQEPGQPDEGLRALAVNVAGRMDAPPAGLEVEVVPTGQRWAHLDLTIDVAEIDGGLTVVAAYDASLHDRASTEALLDQWVTLLRQMTRSQHLPVGRLPLLSPRQFAAAVAAGTGAAAPLEPLSLHALVERRWRTAPDGIAVVAVVAEANPAGGVAAGDAHLSAGCARRWTATLAGRLRAAGVGPGSRVGILLDRCAGLPVAMLAVLRLGAAYVPLDAGDPSDRLAWTVADAGVNIVLSDTAHAPAAPPGLTIVMVEPGTERPAAVVPSHPEQPAYLIYTSGSTGRQKGVVVPHRAIVNRLLWMSRALPLRPDDRVLQRTPTTFDVSVWELFLPLIEGVVLVMAPPGAQRDPELLARVLRRQQITVTHSVPAALTQLLPHLGDGLAEPSLALRLLVSSGEAMPAALRDRFHRTCCADLHNLYGPTEAAVDVTWWPCRRSDTGPVPIGLPIDATEVHVVGVDGLPVPAGTVGEVTIAGRALAHGYRGRPGTTAATWRPHPFGSRSARIYHTGDLGSRDSDGAITFLGRKDTQVSIAGRRVELGEVEDTLRRGPGVRDAVVAATDGGDGVRLVGYFVPTDERAGDLSELRGWLRRHLPAALVPAELHVLPHLPLTANGKLDRAQLPAAATPRPAAAEGWDDPLQRQIADIWSAVLGAARVRPDDDFFALGGDSITALRVVAALRSEGVDVRVAELLAGPTVRALADTLRGQRADALRTSAPAPFDLCPPGVAERLPPDAVDAYPVSSAQLAVLFHQLHGERHEVYVTSLLLGGPFDQDRMATAVKAVWERHPYLRSSFDLAAYREPLQVVHGSVAAPLEVVDLRSMGPEHCDAVVADWLQRERTRPFHVEHGPLARVTVHLRGDATWRLTLSSFALDGWATATVLTELLTAHWSGPSADRAPRTDYRTFVALERNATGDPAHRAFWARELAGAPVLHLPPSIAGRTGGGATTRRIEVPMKDSTATRLRRLARRLQVSERTLLLTAHLRVVRALTGAPEVLTGVEVTGRPEEPDGDRVVGVFNNILPLRVAVTGTWTDLVQATAAAERRVAAFRRYPMPRMERDLGRPGLLQTMYVHTHFHLYQDVRQRGNVEILDSWAPDRTYVPLTAHTNVDAATGCIRLLLDVDPEEVDDRTAQLAAELYPKVWEAMVDDPDASCTAATLVDGADLRRQSRQSEGGEGPAGPPSPLDLVLAQVERTPDRIAFRTEHEQCSYRVLADRARALGAALRAAGVEPDTVVAVPARRTAELPVSLLGVWAAGAAYLPLDPAQPLPLLRSTLARANVTHAVMRAEDPLAAAVATAIPATAASRTPCRSAPRDPRMLGYVLPTSGSTGPPRLVGIPHGAVVNYLLWCRGAYGGEGRTLVHSPVEFDLTVTSLLGPLVAGGSVDLLPDSAGPEALGRGLSGADGLLKITPAHLAVVADQLQVSGERAPAVPVVVGGESLNMNQVRAWRAAGGSGPLINEYGPTEATVGCVTWTVDSDATGPGVPVGRPIPGTRARVMDGVDVVPDTVTGELAIGGRGLARGYVGAPGTTAARFVPDPLGNGERLYMTGDAARRDHEGLLHVLGRRDRQLKIRGRRVEPAATEAVLTAHPDVRAAAVTAVPTGPDRFQLIGYWVSEDAGVPGAAALTAWLRRQLAPHQVPDALMWLPVLPLTSRGKVDVAALPDPRRGQGPALAALAARLSDADVRTLLHGAAGKPA